MGNRKIWRHKYPLMCYTPENIPDLRSFPLWPSEEFPWFAEIEKQYESIREELFAARDAPNCSGFQPYRDPAPANGDTNNVPADGLGVEGVDKGAWNVLYLFLNHKRFEDNCARFPKTIEMIERCFPRHYSHAFFSALTPGAHIIAHKGPSNRMLRVWLPICGMMNFRLRVQNNIVSPVEGKVFAWDHSYEHEAWHDGDEVRVTLIVDVWHPDLTDAEIKLLSAMQSCRLRAARELIQNSDCDFGDSVSHMDLIERCRNLLTDDDWWVLRAEQDPTTRPT